MFCCTSINCDGIYTCNVNCKMALIIKISSWIMRIIKVKRFKRHLFGLLQLGQIVLTILSQ